jgi:hypothetical protein
MVFAVLSSSSEGFDSNNYVKVGRKAFIDILATNRLFIQDSKASLNELFKTKFVKEDESFRSFLDINMNDISLEYIPVYILLFTVLGYCLNNFIRKNNIWRSAVF